MMHTSSLVGCVPRTIFIRSQPAQLRDHLPAEFLDRYADDLSDQAKLDLYHLLASGPPEQIERELRKVWDQATAQGWEMRSGKAA
jgi:hypothetical protein